MVHLVVYLPSYNFLLLLLCQFAGFQNFPNLYINFILNGGIPCSAVKGKNLDWMKPNKINEFLFHSIISLTASICLSICPLYLNPLQLHQKDSSLLCIISYHLRLFVELLTLKCQCSTSTISTISFIFISPNSYISLFLAHFS